MSYDYKQGKANIEKILSQTNEIEKKDLIPSSDSDYTYSNGYRCWVGAIFVDMRKSSTYFTDNKDTTVAKVMRAFTSEVITILADGNKHFEIGIRGDCVYAIYSAPKKEDLKELFVRACTINTFQDMFQLILKKRNIPGFSIGIGLGASMDLVIKAGKSGKGIHDYIWIGDAVIDASNLSSLGKSGYGYPIYADSTFYINVKHFKANEKETYESLFVKDHYNGDEVYKCNIVSTQFSDWVSRGFKE